MHQYEPGEQFYVLTEAELGKPHYDHELWVKAMNKYVGQTLTHSSRNVSAKPQAHGYYFPSECIRPVPKLNLYF